MVFCYVSGQAQNIIPNHSNAIEINSAQNLLYSADWYRQQEIQWRNVIKESEDSPEAWFNLYKARRYSNYTGTTKDIPAMEQAVLDGIVDDMQKHVPNSFEFCYTKYLNGNNDPGLFPYLEKAYGLEPHNVELYDDMIAYYELTGNENKKKEFCRIWNNSNDIPADIMNYNYNVLMSLEQNAILITNGKYDTYPVLILQNVKNIRPDVMVLNIDLLLNQDYRERMFSKTGIVLASDNDINTDKSGFFKALVENNSGKTVYFGLTVSPEVISLFKDKLYPTGLVLKYSDQDFDNLSVLVKNWEDNFKKDYLKDMQPVNGMGVQLSVNYILPLMLIYKYYKELGNDKDMDEVLKIMERIAGNYGMEDVIDRYLAE